MAHLRGGKLAAILRRADQAAVAAILVFCLILLAGYWIQSGALRGRLIEIDRAPRQTVEFRLDLNRADWPELTSLPGVSETLARRIVKSRQRAGPFRSVEELDRVNGIGPKSIERIRPFLLPIETTVSR